MTLFEFVTVAVSIVLSFGVVRLLDGLRPSLHYGNRYWIHAVWVFAKLSNFPIYWWGLWRARELADWNLLLFVLALIPPALLYLQSTALVTTSPGRVSDWRSHFYSIRRWFFGINIALMVVGFIEQTAYGVPILDPSRIPVAVSTAFSIVGAISSSPRVHAVIAVAAAANIILGFGFVFFQPGGVGAF